MTNSSETVAKILLKIKAISLNPKEPFRYDSGILSPVYIDNRLLISYPEERKIIRDLYIESMNSTGQQFDLIAATATAGIPHAAWVADKLNLPMVFVRGKAKDHGKKNRVEGVVKKRAKTAVIEDLISTGESSIETAKAVIGTGGEVSYIFAIITYGMKKADENFKANNLKLITLTTFADVLEIAEKSGQISGKEKEIILDWTKDPESWGKKNGF
ncbi:MAG: orotate phosphoribosyltransferase [uncultured bacterium]|uniref:Orotate phosphoribosyltransferase n=2 Tax=Microgenomates group TaxID=1794810 RepID=A0A0G0T402_9BACT|nr:MAG: orotate phosphoribosyltransferase [uncultured bacterium]KKQ75808.1 MAG: Orotate phosphoribosyltransferase [Candidatus Woesebacteria bacterium GW2011_GWB1_38_5b]KKR16560.1 MAG: Orotate phosphoribosyltransferase [Candidatus Daviesbacteria bacterium GW2011_GWA2_39_33]KKR41825.1 MAG: Orotate phosphoribosyltransferase [Candidatus Daviesbacteria bacterium GW2011_GWC2_40_12]OGE21096.1 MAG: orotate phosphoribosyltransferase [Candidatus Daviesbacteria bacterium RIFCSPHIGHO2_01_FULL_40_24]OGE289